MGLKSLRIVGGVDASPPTIVTAQVRNGEWGFQKRTWEVKVEAKLRIRATVVSGL
jgi:hypothetical protein